MCKIINLVCPKIILRKYFFYEILQKSELLYTRCHIIDAYCTCSFAAREMLASLALSGIFPVRLLPFRLL